MVVSDVSDAGTNAPNGNVGVHGWLRNADNTRYYPGVIMGFVPGFNGMMVWPANGTHENPSHYNVCLAINPNGDMDVFALNRADYDSNFTLSAPTSPGQSRCYAIVASKSGTAVTSNNDGIGSVIYTAVPGADAAKGTELPPTDDMIRRQIPDGDTAYVCVVSTIQVNYGDTSLSSESVNASLQGKQSVVVNQQIAPGLQCISHERSNHAYLIGSKRSAGSNIWSYRQYSDGAVELYMEYVPGGSYDFDAGPVWHTAYIPKPPDYPLKLVYDGSVHGVTRSVSLEAASNDRTGIAYTGTPHSVQEHQTNFGGIRVTDRDQGTLYNPVFGLSVNGWWY